MLSELRCPTCRICRLGRSSRPWGREGGGPGLPRPPLPRLRPRGRAEAGATLEERIGKAEGKGTTVRRPRLEARRPDRDEEARAKTWPGITARRSTTGLASSRTGPGTSSSATSTSSGSTTSIPSWTAPVDTSRVEDLADALGAAGVPVPDAGEADLRQRPGRRHPQGRRPARRLLQQADPPETARRPVAARPPSASSSRCSWPCSPRTSACCRQYLSPGCSTTASTRRTASTCSAACSTR